MLKGPMFLAVIALAALTRAGSLEEIVDANGELTLNLKGGQVESCSFADDFHRLLYVTRAGYEFGTSVFKHGGVALVRKDGNLAWKPEFFVDRRERTDDGTCLHLYAPDGDGRIGYSVRLGKDRLALACDSSYLAFVPYFSVSDSKQVRLENVKGGCRLVDPLWRRTIAVSGGGTWSIAPVKADYPVGNIHELEAPAYVRLESSDVSAGMRIEITVEGKGAVPAPTPVADVTKWKGRRAELRALLEREVYGVRPVERPDGLTFEPVGPDRVMMNGRAVRKRVRARWQGPFASHAFEFTAFVPNRPGPHPAFLLICNRDPKANIDPERERKSGFWPAEQIVGRGYAALAFWNEDLAPDDNSTNFVRGVYRCWRKDGSRTDDSWGALSAWAWGASRVMDWIETEPSLDAKHVAVVGHSRGGKTALLAGALDERFAMCCPNDAGMSGDKLNHIDLPESESLAVISKAFPHWFCGNYAKYAGREKEAPFDQHELVALVAPRLVAIGSASRDFWAGQLGQWWSARLASPMWEAYGRKGLEPKAMPAVIGGAPAPGTCLQEGSISFHCRPGGHNLTPYDWTRYMDFADRHGWVTVDSADRVFTERK